MMKVADYLTVSLESERLPEVEMGALLRQPADVLMVAELAVRGAALWGIDVDAEPHNWPCLLSAAKCIADGEGDVCDIQTCAEFCRDELREHAEGEGELPSCLAQVGVLLNMLEHVPYRTANGRDV